MTEVLASSAASQNARPSLLRFIFRLPLFLPLPDGTQICSQYPHPVGVPEEQTPFAIVRLHQIALDSNESTVDYLAADAAMARVSGGAALDQEPLSLPNVTAWHTVADVIATWQSPDTPGADWDGRPQHLSPRQDAVMRAVDAVRALARAVRLCGQPRIILPSYENLPLMWLQLDAPQENADDGAIRIPPDNEWVPIGLVLMDHTNIAGAEVTDPATQQKLYERSSFWAHGLKVGNPALLAREQLIVAQRLLNHDGDYAAVVVAAATAVEVMIDSLLSALMWEERLRDPEAPSAVEAAVSFGEGKSAARTTSDLPPRLGGDWSGPKSHWQRWRSGGATLRNRVVHDGYQPTRAEAQGTIDLAYAFQRFTYDRLTVKAKTYPRSTLMLVARSGRIKRFNEKEARLEPSWSEGFSAWHSDLVAAIV